MLLVLTLVGFGLINAQIPDLGGVTGVVISADDDEPVVGASVMVKGTKTGTSTDIDGKFTISKLPRNAKTLVVSYIGMKTKQVAIQRGTKMTITLESDAE